MKKRKTVRSSTTNYASDSTNEQELEDVEGEQRLSDDSNDDDQANVEPKGSRKAAVQLGFASAFAKVMQQEKPKKKKHVFLSKSKKLHDQLEEKDDKVDFEIDGEVKEEKPNKEELDEDIETRLNEKKNKTLTLRMKPSLMDREREKAFKKIATKGVVQLFNAVRMQQKDLAKKLDEVGPLDHRKDAVLNNINKKKFLDVLMGGSRAKSEFVDNPVKDEVKEESDDDSDYMETDRPDPSKSQWNVLR